MNNNIDNIIEKRMKTIMIGSLARFEENFDYLWRNNSNSTDEKNAQAKKYFLDLWQKTRQDILDYGNNQIRLAKKDLDYKDDGKLYKHKYHYRFNMRRDNDEY